jgi:hypothetical protein
MERYQGEREHLIEVQLEESLRAVTTSKPTDLSLPEVEAGLIAIVTVEAELLVIEVAAVPVAVAAVPVAVAAVPVAELVAIGAAMSGGKSAVERTAEGIEESQPEGRWAIGVAAMRRLLQFAHLCS